METMIPNQVRFDLDLQDLPTRATQVEYDRLSLIGGGPAYVKLCSTYFRSGKLKNPNRSWEVYVQGVEDTCRDVCYGNTYPTKKDIYNHQGSRLKRAKHTGGGFFDVQYECSCCNR